MTLFLPPEVRYAVLDGVVILLDLTTGEYLALDEAASDIWVRLVEHAFDVDATVMALDEERHQEVHRFIDYCVAQGLLAQTAPVAKPVRQLSSMRRGLRRAVGRHFLTPRAWFHLVSTWVLIRARGVSPTYLALMTEPSQDRPSATAPLGRAVDAFVRAENLFWFRGAPNDCLPRSIALFRFLRALGIPARHCIGGTRFPSFLMHAWVESGDQPLLDDPELIRTFTLLSTSDR